MDNSSNLKFKEGDFVMIDLGTKESENGQDVPAQELGVIDRVDESDDDSPYLVAPLRDMSDTGWLTQDEVRRPTRMEVTTCDPDSPLAKFLVGKEVLYGDTLPSVFTDDGQDKGLLGSIDKDSGYPFHVGGNIFSMISAPLPKEEDETVEVTMAEVCAKFGKNVKIKKE